VARALRVGIAAEGSGEESHAERLKRAGGGGRPQPDRPTSAYTYGRALERIGHASRDVLGAWAPRRPCLEAEDDSRTALAHPSVCRAFVPLIGY
jgi:hypothetical protein